MPCPSFPFPGLWNVLQGVLKIFHLPLQGCCLFLTTLAFLLRWLVLLLRYPLIVLSRCTDSSFSPPRRWFTIIDLGAKPTPAKVGSPLSI